MRVFYKLPVPVDRGKTGVSGVLPIVILGGAEVTVGSTDRDFDLVFSLSI